MALPGLVDFVAAVFEQGHAEAVDGAERCAKVVGNRIAEGLEFLVGIGEFRGALGEAGLQVGVGFGTCAKVGHLQDAGNDVGQEDRGANGSSSADRFNCAGEPILGVPEVPCFHEVGDATGDDEGAEKHENPTERNIAPLASEPQQHGNGEIGGGDQQVGNRMQPDHTGVPGIADAVRLKTAGVK